MVEELAEKRLKAPLLVERRAKELKEQGDEVKIKDFDLEKEATYLSRQLGAPR